MLRCNSLHKHCLNILLSFGLLVFLFPGPFSGKAQTYRFSSDSVSDERKSDATVSMRDLSIPRKAFDAYQHGLQKLQKQDNASSIRDFTKAIEKFPQFYEAYYHLGVAQKRLGDNDKAMASFQTAISLSDGKYALAEYASALLLCQQGKAAEAERTVLYALESNDHRPLGHVILGTVMLYMNRLEEAERYAREALSLDTTTQDAYLVLAAVHGERNDYAAEVKDLDAFLRLEPSGPRNDNVRGIRSAAEGLVAHLSQKP